MPPTKGRIAMNAGPGRRLANTLAVDQGLGEYAPSLTMTQPGKRRAGQGIERATTRMAFVALQATGMTKSQGRTRRAMRTTRYAERVQFTRNRRRRIRPRKRVLKPLFLCGAQRRKTTQPLIEIACFHREQSSSYQRVIFYHELTMT